MEFIIFDQDDQKYQNWMNLHPDGFVANARRRNNSTLFFLHRSGCNHIRISSSHRAGAFTERDYIKVCSTYLDTLMDWAKKNRNISKEDIQFCKSCHPLELDYAKLNKRVKDNQNADFPDMINEHRQYAEGAIKHISVNTYERNAQARIECLNYWGQSCRVCGLDFKAYYGNIGNGFIHVHHLVPLSKVSADYRVDPIQDLRPVCPNCHAMLHKTEPPLTVEELRNNINKLNNHNNQ